MDNYGDLVIIEIPPHKPRRFEQEKNTVVLNEKEWEDNIQDNVVSKLDKQGVLLLCESIRNAEYLNQLIKNRNKRTNIKTIFSSEDALKVVNREVKIGDIIIATMLGARGCDIKVEKRMVKGLHVVITFLPQN